MITTIYDRLFTGLTREFHVRAPLDATPRRCLPQWSRISNAVRVC